MKKLAFALATLFFASAASAQVITNPTTNARMDGLGVANHQIEDDFNIWNNPAQINNYKSGIFLEVGDFFNNDGGITANNVNQDNNITGQWGGMHMEAGAPIGIYLGRPAEGLLSILDDPSDTTDINSPTANRLDFFLGLPGAPFGLYLGVANQSEENGTTDSSLEVNLGAGALLMDGMLEAALNIGMASGENDESGTKIEGSGFSLAAFGRLHQNHTGGKFLYAGGLEITGATIDDVADIGEFNLFVDATCNSKPNDDTLLIAGVGLLLSNMVIEPDVGEDITSSEFAVPVNLAVEHQTFKKVKTRVGLSKHLFSTATFDDGTDEVTTIADGPATVSTGFGWMVHDNLMVDFVVNQDVLFTGTYVVSGVPESLSSKISGTYRFE